MAVPRECHGNTPHPEVPHDFVLAVWLLSNKGKYLLLFQKYVLMMLSDFKYRAVVTYPFISQLHRCERSI